MSEMITTSIDIPRPADFTVEEWEIKITDDVSSRTWKVEATFHHHTGWLAKTNNCPRFVSRVREGGRDTRVTFQDPAVTERVMGTQNTTHGVTAREAITLLMRNIIRREVIEFYSAEIAFVKGLGIHGPK